MAPAVAGRRVGAALGEQRRSAGAGSSVCGFMLCLKQQQQCPTGPVAAWLGSIASAWASYRGNKKKNLERLLRENFIKTLCSPPHTAFICDLHQSIQELFGAPLTAERAVSTQSRNPQRPAPLYCQARHAGPSWEGGGCSPPLLPPSWSPTAVPGTVPSAGQVTPGEPAVTPCASHLLLPGAENSSPSPPLALRAPLLIPRAGVGAVYFLPLREPLGPGAGRSFLPTSCERSPSRSRCKALELGVPRQKTWW